MLWRLSGLGISQMPAGIDVYAYICQVCGSTYESWMKVSKYCSRACRDASMRTVLPGTCANCGVAVRKKKYCSHSCYAKSLEGCAPNNYRRISIKCSTCGGGFVWVPPPI